jgi:starch synthase
MSGAAYSDGINNVIASRHGELSGIIHGVDNYVWNPKNDSYLARNYDRTSVNDKFLNKERLLNRVGLPVQYTTPLIGMISRFSEQKGVRLLLEAADELFAENVQLIILGEGDPELQDAVSELKERFPTKVGVKIGFDDELAHLIEASADMFLMPSLFEPCGLNQLYSFVYGTVPIVRATGGLADTVSDFNPETKEGNGFVFQEFAADAMLVAVRRALHTFHEREQWEAVQQNGMNGDYSWSASGRYYSELYRSLLRD